MAIQRTIVPGTTAYMESLAEEAWLEEPLFAINWFRAKRPRVYALYGALAARSVFRTGGKLLFKGEVSETLTGDAGGRDTLLIVNYPSAASFLDLLSGRFFQMVSPLRMMAVRRFSFVMQRRSDGPATLKHRRQRFDTTQYFAAYIGLEKASDENSEGVETVYEGAAAIEVAMKGRGSKKTLPYETPCLRVVSAGTESALRRWAQAQSQATCVVLLTRVL